MTINYEFIVAFLTALAALGGLSIFAIKQYKENKSLFKNSILREEKVTQALAELPSISNILNDLSQKHNNLQKRVIIVETKTDTILEHLLEGLPKEEIAISILEKLKRPNNGEILTDKELLTEITVLANRLLSKSDK